MREPVDVLERRRLCDLLLELGPDAPTLCEGWTTADLAAHLTLREHFHGSTEAAIQTQKDKGFPTLVAQIRVSPPWPWRIPLLRSVLNGTEYVIHHEDVRRANGFGPRTNVPEVEQLAWRANGFLGRRLARNIRPFGLELAGGEGRHKTFGHTARLILRGGDTDILLFLTGRRSAAHVDLEGPSEAITAINRSESTL